MKKKFFLIGAIAAMSCSTLFVSCGNSNDGCTCTWTEDGEQESGYISKEEMEKQGYETCKAVAKSAPSDISNVKCK